MCLRYESRGRFSRLSYLSHNQRGLLLSVSKGIKRISSAVFFTLFSSTRGTLMSEVGLVSRSSLWLLYISELQCFQYYIKRQSTGQYLWTVIFHSLSSQFTFLFMGSTYVGCKKEFDQFFFTSDLPKVCFPFAAEDWRSSLYVQIVFSANNILEQLLLFIKMILFLRVNNRIFQNNTFTKRYIKPII